MAVFNRGMNEHALDALDIQDAERVLAIGFGSGRLIPLNEKIWLRF